MCVLSAFTLPSFMPSFKFLLLPVGQQESPRGPRLNGEPMQG